MLVAGSGIQIAVADVFSFTNTLPIPDGNAAGMCDVETLPSGISQIGSVLVQLNIRGDFNGDLYCYLKHGNALSVLLNRPGRTSSNPFGYADSGLNITLNDFALNGNVHNYGVVQTPAAGLPLTGAWQPDGRTTIPFDVLDSDVSMAGLNVFQNLNASGSWTLFVADLSSGGTSVLNSWQLIIEPVPEPSAFALAVLGLGLTISSLRNKESKPQ